MTALQFVAATADDFEALSALRIAAMRESLEAVGRFDPERSRARLLQSFDPAQTFHIVWQNERVGFYVLKQTPTAWTLDHLYIHPAHQAQGLGGKTLQQLLQTADAVGMQVKVGALRGSRSNAFYQRHGFVQTHEEAFDIYYERPCQS